MSNYLVACLGLVLLLPMQAHADVRSSTSATSNSGGSSAGQGGTVITGGSSASVQVSDISGDSASSFYIKTDVNGQVYEETIKDASGHIEVSVQAHQGAAEVEIKKGNPATVVKKILQASAPAPAATTTAHASSSVSAAAESTPAHASGILARIFDWLGGLFDFLR